MVKNMRSFSHLLVSIAKSKGNIKSIDLTRLQR